MIRKFEFLIIGSGVAGMSYALKVANAGKGKVALICKTTLEEVSQFFFSKIEKGEILALLGENGSGKTTLVNMLAGLYAPDEGSIFIDGVKHNFGRPADSIAAGIGMVHQHYLLVDVMSALENITMGEEKAGFFLNKKEIREKILKLEETYGLKIDPDKKIYDMSVSEKQTVEILKVLYRGANILILDEPTAVLTPQEAEMLWYIPAEGPNH